MKLHVSLAAAVIVIATAAALWSGRTGFAQEEGEVPIGEPILGDSDPHAELSAAVRKKIKLHAGNEMFHVRFAGPPQDAMRKAAEELRDAEDDDAKEEAREKLTELLDEYFEEDMSRREQELKDVEARLEKLRTQLARRREKKQEIVDLQLKVAVNEADGLGFFGGPGGPRAFEVPIGELNFRGLPHTPPARAPQAAPSPPGDESRPRDREPRAVK